MKYFYIQTDENGIPLHDFGYTLLKSLEYLNWAEKEKTFDYLLSSKVSLDSIDGDEDNYIPIGSIEFVTEFVEYMYGIDATKELKPFYPLFLNGHFCGNIFKTNPYTMAKLQSNSGLMFHIKNINKLKHNLNGEYSASDILCIPEFNNDNWICQESYTGNFLSEWRCFVYHDELLSIRCYDGDEFVLPSKDVINNIISELKDIKKYNYNVPPAYTLDVGVVKYDNSTKIVEIHEFYSCGLYGFEDQKRLPYMFSQTWFNIINRIRKK